MPNWLGCGAALLCVGLTALAVTGTARSQVPTSTPPTVAEPTAANAPKSLSELACPPAVAGGLAGMDLLTPQRNMPLPQGRRQAPESVRVRQLYDPAALCRCRDANRALPPATSRRVVFVGDSITEGWLAAAPSFFADEVINRGISGQNTSQMLLRFREDVLNLRPRVIHVMAGVNDINTPAGAVLTRSNIMSMVELAQAQGIRVVLASITPSSRFWSNPDVLPGPQIAELNN